MVWKKLDAYVDDDLPGSFYDRMQGLLHEGISEGKEVPVITGEIPP